MHYFFIYIVQNLHKITKAMSEKIKLFKYKRRNLNKMYQKRERWKAHKY